MKTIMARTPHESSFSFSRRYFNWKKKPEDFLHHHNECSYDDHDYNEEDQALASFESSSHSFSSLPSEDKLEELKFSLSTPTKNKLSSVSKLKSLFAKGRSSSSSPRRPALGSKVVGTLFGYRRGHVRIAFQVDPTSAPAFLIELSTPTSVLVREMASGLVRIALECDKKFSFTDSGKKKGGPTTTRLLEEPLWRAYCNGKKCGYAMRRECGPDEWRVLRSVGPITMGAGVLPLPEEGEDDGPPGLGPTNNNNNNPANRVVGVGGAEGELMYMRAKFERIVGSKDSEAFYMMNPDHGNGGPELSVYLLRV